MTISLLLWLALRFVVDVYLGALGVTPCDFARGGQVGTRRIAAKKHVGAGEFPAFDGQRQCSPPPNFLFCGLLQQRECHEDSDYTSGNAKGDAKGSLAATPVWQAGKNAAED
jgi:hypothetical protein